MEIQIYAFPASLESLSSLLSYLCLYIVPMPPPLLGGGRGHVKTHYDMKKTFLFVCGAFAACCFVGCGTTPRPAKEEVKNLPEHVIIVGFDGFSSHSVNNGADMPTLRRLMAEGASTLQNRSILPSSSACNWASMFMGAGPELHGYTEWGSRVPELPSRVVNADNRFPNIFGLYRDKAPQAEIGYIYEWDGMNYLVDTLAMSFRKHAPMGEENPKGCTSVAVEYIKEKKPNLCAIIYDQPDGAGHGKGWSSPEYFAMINHLDSCLAEVVGAVEEAGMMDETVIMVVSDHGGIETGHGGKTMNEMQTPIVFYGKNIKKGFTLPESTMVYDIAGTVAYMLDVEQPQVWIARPIRSVFQNPEVL